MSIATMSRAWRKPARLFVFLAMLLSQDLAWSLDVPPLTGRVMDLAHVLSTGETDRLTADLQTHETATGNQVVVLTLPSLEGEPLEPFAHRVATTWKLGQKGTDNGALLLVALKERKVRIEVGYGLEGALTDAKSAQIIRNEMVPSFRAGNFPGGITAGVAAILKTIEGTYQAPERPPVSVGGGDVVGQVVMALIVGVVFGLALSNVNRAVGVLTGTGLSVWLSPWLIPAIGAGLVTLLLVLVLGGASPGRRGRGFDDWTSYSSRGGGWGGGGFGGGGGGFSGGGGDFGGGGSSGDW
ncbi:MAG: TPM domain-containing protein [Nitrospira sp.]|nr:TPM domain-containing protein [Nitrospira sp.]